MSTEFCFWDGCAEFGREVQIDGLTQVFCEVHEPMAIERAEKKKREPLGVPKGSLPAVGDARESFKDRKRPRKRPADEEPAEVFEPAESIEDLPVEFPADVESPPEPEPAVIPAAAASAAAEVQTPELESPMVSTVTIPPMTPTESTAGASPEPAPVRRRIDVTRQRSPKRFRQAVEHVGGKIYASLGEAEQALGIARNSLSPAIRLRGGKVKGMSFRLVDAAGAAIKSPTPKNAVQPRKRAQSSPATAKPHAIPAPAVMSPASADGDALADLIRLGRALERGAKNPAMSDLLIAAQWLRQVRANVALLDKALAGEAAIAIVNGVVEEA